MSRVPPVPAGYGRIPDRRADTGSVISLSSRNDERFVIDAAPIKADRPMAYADPFAEAVTVASDATLWTGDAELLIDGSSWRFRDLRT